MTVVPFPAKCPNCHGDAWYRYFSETTDGDLEEAFRLCDCRCFVGQASDNPCPNLTTYKTESGLSACEPHGRETDLEPELEDWEDALFYVNQCLGMASHVGNTRLSSLMKSAGSEAESNIERIRAELASLWSTE